MLSTTEANENAKFFTHNWTLKLPARPSLKYIHLTEAQLGDYIPLIMDPANSPYEDHWRTKVWDDKAIEEFKESMKERIKLSQSTFGSLNTLIELDGQIIGGTNFFLLPSGKVNIGLLLAQSARRKGIGRISLQVLIQLARQTLGIEGLEAGTMKVNMPMRALMASLKIPERDEIKEAPGRGVVAEVMYTIPEKLDWDEIDFHVEFGEPAGSAGDKLNGAQAA